MKTLLIYYVILSVYISLLSCQLVACHLTHSLIILTDSYINLYKILDISLGIIHLRTQQELLKRRTTTRVQLDKTRLLASSSITTSDSHTRTVNDNDSCDKGKKKLPHDTTLAGRIFGCVCTYQFKRLSLLGSFVNGLFLAALLMSAAIEGIQTCFHSGHSQGHDQKTILTENPRTYPLILVGFALVDLIMQHCSLKAHEMREEELMSESLLELNNTKSEGNHKRSFKELNVANLVAATGNKADNIELTDNGCRQRSPATLLAPSPTTSAKSSDSGGTGKRRSYDLVVSPQHRGGDGGTGNSKTTSSSIFRSTNCVINSNSEALPPTSLSDFNETRISLKSLKYATDSDCLAQTPETPQSIESMPKDLEAPQSGDLKLKQCAAKSKSARDKRWFWIRYVTSPLALITCASVVYFIDNELATEVSDATLSVLVVTLLFAASYPPMKEAGKVLLQSAPDGVDLDKLEAHLLATSPLVMEVKNLHVWSLTPRSNRVATCQLVLDKCQVRDDQRAIEQIISEAKFRFLDQNIRCTTVEPILMDKSERTKVG